MAAPAPPPPYTPADVAAFAAELAEQLALHTPLALLPGMKASLDTMQGNLALLPGMRASLAGMQASLDTMQAQLNEISGLLLAINPAGLAAGTAGIPRAIEAARALDRHDRRGVLLAPVPRMDGTPPPSWPPGGFRRDDLIKGAVAPIDALLADYGLPARAAGGSVAARRAALARALGTCEI